MEAVTEKQKLFHSALRHAADKFIIKHLIKYSTILLLLLNLVQDVRPKTLLIH